MDYGLWTMDYGLKKAMENILYNISQVLGITVIHSLWQALLVYFMLRAALLLGGKLSASSKYLVAVSALFAITGWFFYTLITEINVYEWIVFKAENASVLPVITGIPATIHQFNDVTTRYYYDIEQYLPYIAMLYIAGLLFNTGKLIVARKKLDAIKQNMSIDVGLQYLVNKFSDVFGISKKVKIGLSNLVDVPCMAGYIKPVILLPFTLTTYLSAQELEAIVLHELAHIKRNDYLVNLLQQVIAILLFFNPCAILINRIINEERENCCDDLVVKAIASPLIYAKALLKLEQTRHNDQKLALAATGKKYHLLNRIERIMKTKNTIGNTRQVLLLLSLFIISVISVTVFNPKIAEGKISLANVKPAIKKAVAAVAPAFIADTTPKKHVGSAKKAIDQGSQPPQNIADITNDHSNGYQVLGFGDAKMDEIGAELNKHKKILNEYFETPEYKDLKANEEKSRLATGYYDNDTLRNIQLSLDQILHQINSNWGSRDGKLAELYNQRDELGSEVGAYYSSDAFKTLNGALQKKYNIDPNKIHVTADDANYGKYQAELENKLPAEVKEERAKLKNLSDQLYEQDSSPQFRAAFTQLKLVIDSLKNYYKRPHIRQYVYKGDDFQIYSKRLNDYKNKPEIIREQAIIRDLGQKIGAYMETPEFKQHVLEWRNQLRTAMGDTYNAIVLHPEKQETDK